MTGKRGATRSSMMPQPTRWRRATLPKSPVNRQETEVIEVVRQLRKTARAVAIRAPSISYCESFAIANLSRFDRAGRGLLLAARRRRRPGRRRERQHERRPRLLAEVEVLHQVAHLDDLFGA